MADAEKELNIVNATQKAEISMATEDRMNRMESNIDKLQKDVSVLQKDVSVLQKDVSVLQKDVSTLHSDVKELKIEVKSLHVRVNESIIAAARESAALRADMERGFGSLRTEIEKHKVETEKSIGLLKAAIESAKLWMLVTGVGSVIMLTFVNFLGRALKLF